MTEPTKEGGPLGESPRGGPLVIARDVHKWFDNFPAL